VEPHPLPPEALALDDLILGRGVKRGRHALPGGLDALFRERLAALGFVETTVGAVEIRVGVRVPAWLVSPGVADFGTVFWELFTESARRKLFGSEVRNAKGDWEIQVPPSSPRRIWAGLHLAEEYDASRPVGMF
jgi:hypothetical protein